MAKKKTTKQMSGKQKASVGIGLTAAAVTAASAYFLYGSKNAAKNRKKVKGWALKAKGEVLEALEKAETITQEEYEELVDKATKVYGSLKHATSGEIKDFKKEMDTHWSQLQRSSAVKKFIATKKKAKKKVTNKKAKKTAAKKKTTKKKASKKPSKKKAVKKTAKKRK